MLHTEYIIPNHVADYSTANAVFSNYLQYLVEISSEYRHFNGFYTAKIQFLG
jgi:hypothetical protein